MRQVGDWHPQRVVGLLGQVLDAVLDQRHQRRQLVGRRAQARLQDRHHTLAEQQRISGLSRVCDTNVGDVG